MAKAHANSWEVTDAFWARVEPLVPKPQRDPNKLYKRSAGAGRPPEVSPLGVRGHRVCTAHGVSVESAAARALWQRQCGASEVHGLVQGGLL